MKELFQYPFTGSSHFYTNRVNSSKFPNSFQCPSTGSSHFYAIVSKWLCLTEEVSMPYHGLIPFLHGKNIHYMRFWSVSMPYHGLIPFLPKLRIALAKGKHSVSMPYHGLIPFLHLRPLKQKIDLSCFNALPRAHPISTGMSMEIEKVSSGFQCPTTGSSHFYWDRTAFK